MTTNTSTLSKSMSDSMSSTAATSSNNATDPTNFTDKVCCFEKEQDSRDWSCAGEDATFSRKHSGSKLNLEGFDLELPTLEMYQEEFVDFPSSPTHENFQQHIFGGEHDSGNAGAKGVKKLVQSTTPHTD